MLRHVGDEEQWQELMRNKSRLGSGFSEKEGRDPIPESVFYLVVSPPFPPSIPQETLLPQGLSDVEHVDFTRSDGGKGHLVFVGFFLTNPPSVDYLTERQKKTTASPL